MKIIYQSDILNIHDYRFLKMLCEHGYQTYLITYSADKIPDNISQLGKLTIEQKPLPWYFPPTNYTSRVRENFHKGKRFIQETTSFLPRFRHFKRTIDRIRPDVIHAGWASTSGFLTAISGFHPFLLMPWGSDILIEPFESSLSNKLKLIKWRITYAINNSDMITCDCEYVKNKILELSPNYLSEKIIVFPWGVERELFNRNRDAKNVKEIQKRFNLENNFVLINNRGFKEVYGVEYFIQSLPFILKIIPNLKVLLLGDGPLTSKIEEQIKQENLESIVHLVGRVSTNEMPAYLNASHVYASTSLSDGSPVSLLEAMSCGLPVMVTDVSSVLEWIDDGVNGFVVKKRDPAKTAQCIVSLLQQPELRQQMSTTNLKIAEQKIDWNKNFVKLENIYKELVLSK